MKSCIRRIKKGDVVAINCDSRGWWSELVEAHEVRFVVKMKVIERPGRSGLFIECSTLEDEPAYYEPISKSFIFTLSHYACQIIKLNGRDPDSIPEKEIVSK